MGCKEQKHHCQRKRVLEDSHYLISTLIIVYSNQDSVVQCKKGQINQWKRIEHPEIDSLLYGQLIFFFFFCTKFQGNSMGKV